MRNKSAYFAILGCTLLCALLMAGCSSEEKNPVNTTGDPTPEDQTVNLDDPYGGFLVVDENPAFGDENLAELEAGEAQVADGYEGLSEDDRAVAEGIESNSRRWYSLTVVWGHLGRTAEVNGTPQEEDPITWNGSMVLQDGSIRVLSLLSFEPSEDQIITPRPSPGELNWTSITHGGVDGLRVLLMIPTDENSGQPLASELVFNAEPVGEIRFTIDELEDLDEVIDVANSEEQISFTSRRADPAASVRGFCGGYWGWKQGEDVGIFRGRWIAMNGETTGYMRGHYGLNSSEEPVFYGKYIDKQGNFRGFLRGTYEIIREQGGFETPEFAEVGAFEGEWVDGAGNALGSLRGHWSRRGQTDMGRFYGEWRGLSLGY